VHSDDRQVNLGGWVDMRLKSVLFDIGNVIVSDYWESVWLSKNFGLADRLRIPIEKAELVGLQLWEKHAVIKSDEKEYWQDASLILDVIFDTRLIEEVERLTITTNPHILSACTKLRENGIRIGIISNNTSFWYCKQVLQSGIAAFLSEEFVFLSCDYGVEKCGAEWDLFSYAADKVTPQETLIIDDRIRNVERAKALGFKAINYTCARSATPVKGYYAAPSFRPLSLNNYQ
jgi:FMN phosphatase YigB (HAD superfamily)